MFSCTGCDVMLECSVIRDDGMIRYAYLKSHDIRSLFMHSFRTLLPEALVNPNR